MMKTIEFDFNEFTFIASYTVDKGIKGDYLTPDDAPDIKINNIECMEGDDPILWPDESFTEELILDQEEL